MAVGPTKMQQFVSYNLLPVKEPAHRATKEIPDLF
jgi:hypothetical protein